MAQVDKDPGESTTTTTKRRWESIIRRMILFLTDTPLRVVAPTDRQLKDGEGNNLYSQRPDVEVIRFRKVGNLLTHINGNIYDDCR